MLFEAKVQSANTRLRNIDAEFTAIQQTIKSKEAEIAELKLAETLFEGPRDFRLLRRIHYEESELLKLEERRRHIANRYIWAENELKTLQASAGR